VLELPANGSRVLHALGLRQTLSESSREPAFSLTRSASSGFLLSQRPMGAFSDARYGAPCYLIETARLLSILAIACDAHQIPIEFGAHIDQVDTESATLMLNDGSRPQHRAVVIATGIHSNLANCLQQRRPIDTGTYTVLRARSSTSSSKQPTNNITTWVGPDACCLEFPVVPDQAIADDQAGAESRGAEDVELIAVTRDESTGSVDSMLTNLFERRHPGLEKLVDSVREASVQTFTAIEVADVWYSGRCALLGNICHASEAYASYGTAAALEDAWVLSRMMERWDEQPHQGFSDYQRYRRPRAKRLKSDASEQIAELTLPDRKAIWRRNFRLSMTSRFLPEVTMQRLDWLYGYDCIKGFA
jgi:salicylate hydroxylase